MKRILVVLFSLICFIGYAQIPYPTPYTQQGSPSTLVQVRGGWKADSTAMMPKYVDTITANLYKTKLYAGSIIFTTSDGNYWYRSADAARWLLFGNSVTNCLGTQLISGSITWSGSGLIFDATDLDYSIICTRYSSSATTLTLSTSDPTYARIDKLYADITGNVGVITGTPAPNPQEPVINPLSQLDMGIVYIPAGSTVPAGTTQTVIYNENVEPWTGTSDVPSVNFTYGTDPYIGSVSTYLPSAPNDSYISWQYGTTKRFIDVQYLKLWVRINEAFVSRPSPFLDVSFYNGSTKVSADSYVEDGVYNFDFNLIGEWQLVSIPLQGLVVSDSIFDKVNFVIHSAPTSFQLDYVYLLETATVPPAPVGGTWLLNGNSAINDATQYIGTRDAKKLNIGTNGQIRAYIDTAGIKLLLGDTTANVMLIDSNGKIWKKYQPTILADSPVIIYQNGYQDRIKLDTTRRGAAVATQYYADSVGMTKWSTTGNAGTTAGTNFIGTTDDVDLVFKRNGVESGRLNTVLENTSFGVNSLSSNTTGTNNTAIGVNSLSANTDGAYNIAIGDNALLSNTSGVDNVGVGAGVLSRNTTGVANIAIGSAVLQFNTTGYSNISVGASSTNNNTTGIKNIAIGDYTLNSLTTGEYNLAIGDSADIATSSTNNAIAIGHDALAPDSTLSFSPYLKYMFLDLDSASGTAPSIAGIDASGNWRKYATPSGGTPAGNYGNLQINRNGGFSTPASDSLTFSSATLAVKGALTTTGAITASGNVSANLGLFTSGVRSNNNTNIYWNSGPAILGNTNDITFKNAAATAGANVSIGTSAAAASAILDVKSTTKGALLPRMTGAEAEAISSPATGLIIYCNNANGSVITSVGLWNYNGTAWVTAGAKPYQILTGNLTQTSTGAPTFTILQNTTGVTYTTAYTGVGLYTLTANSGTPFTANKTQVFIGGNIATVGGDNYFMNTSINSTTVIGISSGSYGIGFNNDILNNTPIEIRIYP